MIGPDVLLRVALRYGVVIVAGLAAPSAVLATEPSSLRVVIDSQVGCPDAASFLGELRTRLPADLALDETASARATVELRPAGDRFRGILTWTDGQTRSFEAAACETVARAILLSLSMSAAEMSDSRTPTAAETLEPRHDVTPVPAATAIRPAPAPAPPSVRANEARVSYGAVARFFGAAGPANVALGVTAGFGLASTGVVQPSARLTFTRSVWAATEAARLARLRSTLVRAEVCPILLTAGPVDGAPCVAVDAGLVHFQAPYIEETSSGWLSPSLLARGGVRLIGPLKLEVAGGLEVPLTPVRFDHFVDASTWHTEEAYASGPVGLLLETSLVMTFP